MAAQKKKDSKPRSPKAYPKESGGGKRGGGEAAGRKKSQARAQSAGVDRIVNSGGALKQAQNVLRGAAIGAGVSPAVGRAVAKEVSRRALGSKAVNRVYGSTLTKASKGLGKSGAGGRVRSVQTPMGPTLGSTKIGSAAQQAQRMGALAERAGKIADVAARQTAREIGRVAGSAARRATVAGAAAASGAASKKRKKK